jgi:hypothetical protein
MQLNLLAKLGYIHSSEVPRLDFRTSAHEAALCFCGHSLLEHSNRGMRSCPNCACKQFRYIPYRPEEVGEPWLVRRKGFDVKSWRAKCKCAHGADSHDPNRPCRCRACGCHGFMSNFLCVVCDLPWEEHITTTESEADRRAAGLPVGDAFYPLAEHPEMQRAVFETRRAPTAVRPRQRLSEPERSVALLPPDCGGPAGTTSARLRGLGLPASAAAARPGRDHAPQVAPGIRTPKGLGCATALAAEAPEGGGSAFAHRDAGEMLERLRLSRGGWQPRSEPSFAAPASAAMAAGAPSAGLSRPRSLRPGPSTFVAGPATAGFKR